MNQSDYMQGVLGEINRQMVSLLERKMEVVKQLGDAQTEVSGEFPGNAYARYLNTMSNLRKPVENPRVVYQGEPGAYSEMACRDFFGKDVNAIGLYSFDDTFIALDKGEADYAVLPIENSSTGAIRQVYDNLSRYNYFFVGETTVYVNHSLMALPGTKLEDIETIYSHEQGLFQCEAFLSSHPEWKKVPQADTAGSAKKVAELQDPTKAAICSPLAAEIYGLEILKENVNALKNNTTRFIVISPVAELRDHRDKICISLTTTHQSGSLHDILAVFAVHGINMVRLESRPIAGKNWEYMFFIEFIGDLMAPKMDEVIHEISVMASDLRVLGNFTANLN